MLSHVTPTCERNGLTDVLPQQKGIYLNKFRFGMRHEISVGQPRDIDSENERKNRMHPPRGFCCKVYITDAKHKDFHGLMMLF